VGQVDWGEAEELTGWTRSWRGGSEGAGLDDAG